MFCLLEFKPIPSSITAPEGTRIEKTEEKVKVFLKELDALIGKENIAISSVYVGLHPSYVVVSPIYLYNAGPHEALMQVALKKFNGNSDELKDQQGAYQRENARIEIVF